MATTQQVVTSTLPAAFETYYKEGAEGQKGLIPQAFQLYGQGTPQAFQQQYVQPLQAAGLYGEGRVAGLTPTQQQLGQQITQMGTPSQFQMGTGALGSAYGTIGGGLPSLLDQGLVQQYMSPYTQGVVDVAKREAIRDAQKAQLGANLGAARQGTYGGARQLLAQTERERALGTQLGVAQQSADIDRLKTLGAYGDLERAYAQQQIDARYADLMRGIEFPESQLEKLSGFIRGIPMTGSVQTTTTPPPSFASQLSGMGIAGLGLYNAMMGK